jgi:hypothetical protein
VIGLSKPFKPPYNAVSHLTLEVDRMEDIDAFVERAKQIYNERYRDQLEQSSRDMFCVIEPISGDCFLGRTLSEAANACRKVYPDRPTHTVRVGHPVAIHFGMHIG